MPAHNRLVQSLVATSRDLAISAQADSQVQTASRSVLDGPSAPVALSSKVGSSFCARGAKASFRAGWGISVKLQGAET